MVYVSTSPRDGRATLRLTLDYVPPTSRLPPVLHYLRYLSTVSTALSHYRIAILPVNLTTSPLSFTIHRQAQPHFWRWVLRTGSTARSTAAPSSNYHDPTNSFMIYIEPIAHHHPTVKPPFRRIHSTAVIHTTVVPHHSTAVLPVSSVFVSASRLVPAAKLQGCYASQRKKILSGFAVRFFSLGKPLHLCCCSRALSLTSAAAGLWGGS